MKIRKIIWSIFFITAGMILTWEFSSHAKDPHFIVLGPEHAKTLVKQCSRPAPEKFDSTWIPTKKQISGLEKHLKTLEGKPAKLCCMKGQTIKKIGDYYRQYVGLVIKGQKRIYVNAFHNSSGFTVDWQNVPVLSCDGGGWFWGALYDPKTHEFSDLAFNGVI